MLAPLAANQLAAWERLADTWIWHEDNRVARCGDCGKGIFLAVDQLGHRYLYTHEQVLMLTVLHLRNHHADLDPDR